MGEAHIRWTDPFGFHTFTLNAGNVSIIVLPLKMGEYKATMKTLRLIAGSDEPERFGATLYKPGDNPHLINWKVTARTDDVYVRDMYPAEGTNLVLAADYARKPDERDLLCDALYSAGLAPLRIPHEFPLRMECRHRLGHHTDDQKSGRLVRCHRLLPGRRQERRSESRRPFSLRPDSLYDR